MNFLKWLNTEAKQNLDVPEQFWLFSDARLEYRDDMTAEPILVLQSFTKTGKGFTKTGDTMRVKLNEVIGHGFFFSNFGQK